MRHVGKPVAKIDALALVTGRPVYTSDLDLNDHALVVHLLRSPHASARIRSIDTDAARSLPGVACVLTHAVSLSPSHSQTHPCVSSETCVCTCVL